MGGAKGGGACGGMERGGGVSRGGVCGVETAVELVNVDLANTNGQVF